VAGRFRKDDSNFGRTSRAISELPVWGLDEKTETKYLKNPKLAEVRSRIALERSRTLEHDVSVA